MVDAILSDPTQRRWAKTGLSGGLVVPAVFALVLLVAGPRDASEESHRMILSAQRLSWGASAVGFVSLAGLLSGTLPRPRPARQVAACALIFTACYVGSTYVAMMVAGPMLFVVANLLYFLFGFSGV